jgi:hypothetical protein
MLLLIYFISPYNYFSIFLKACTNSYTHMNTHQLSQAWNVLLGLLIITQPINKKPRNLLRGLCYIEFVYSTYSFA